MFKKFTKISFNKAVLDGTKYKAKSPENKVGQAHYDKTDDKH